MGFFATFWTWLNGQLATYIGDNTARLAAALEPAVVTLATLYVMVWGYLHLTGQIEEPVLAGLKRIIVLAARIGGGPAIFGSTTRLIVDTFYTRARAACGRDRRRQRIRSRRSMRFGQSGGAVAGTLCGQGRMSCNGDFGFYLGRCAGLVPDRHVVRLCDVPDRACRVSPWPCCSRSARLFIATLLFEQHPKDFSPAWMAQLANYALITILTVMIGSAAAAHREILSRRKRWRAAPRYSPSMRLHMVLVAVIVFLVLRQVMPIASSLGSGMALSSFGFVSRGVAWGISGTRWAANRAEKYVVRSRIRGVCRRSGATLRTSPGAMTKICSKEYR